MTFKAFNLYKVYGLRSKKSTSVSKNKSDMSEDIERLTNHENTKKVHKLRGINLTGRILRFDLNDVKEVAD